MVNTAFVNYLDQIDNLTETWISNTEKQNHFQTNPTYILESKFDSILLTAPRNLKDFIHQYKCKKEIFDLKERHDSTGINLDTNKNFFSNNSIVDVFLFAAAIISLLVTNFAIYLLCKHKKLRMLVASLALQQVREVDTVTTQEDITTECICKIQIHIFLALTVTSFSLGMFAILHSKN